MFEAFLANTSTQGLSALGTAPQRSFELITGTVRDVLGERHAALFAEPVATQYGDRFDWYAAVSGKPHPLDSFEEEEQALIREDLDTLSADIAEMAEGLLAKDDPDEQRLGEALANALRYPGTDSIYVLVDGEDRQPVLLNWAWVSDTQTAVAGDLSGSEGAARAAKTAAAKAAAAKAAEAAATEAAAKKDTGSDQKDQRGSFWWLLWLLWLLLALMIGAILYLMIEACALRLPGVPGYCPAPGPEASDDARRTLFLRDRIATLERQIGIADRACQPAKEESVIPDVDKARLIERGAREGKLTISLIWDSRADLHLDVRCPAGQVINFDNQRSCGGTLDVGGNHSIETAVPNAIESMYFDAPAAGPYGISVTLFDPQGEAATQKFRLRVRDGDKTELFEGSVTHRQMGWTRTYDVGKGN